MRFDDPLFRQSQQQPGAAAFVDLLSGATTTFAALDSQAQQVASLLRNRSINEGDCVGILCRNRPEFFAILLACARHGAIAVPLNWRMPSAELAPLLLHATPKMIFVGREDAATLLRTHFDRTQIYFLDDEGGGGFSGQLDMLPATGPRQGLDADRPWYILFTSGSSNTPKAVIQTPRMTLANAEAVTRFLNLDAGDSTLCMLPLFHTAGINLYTLPVLFAGGTVLMNSSFNAMATLAAINDGRVSVFFGVPTIYRGLMDHVGFGDADLSQVRHWGCGGAPLPPTITEIFARKGATICRGYGMTETGPFAFITSPDEAGQHPTTVGKMRGLASVRLMNADGTLPPVGESGEVQFKGDSISPGYWRQPELTEAAYTPDGWLKSGDLARYDDDGLLTFTGRLTDMYVSGGENVYPDEVEAAYMKHPDIIEVAVIGVPSEKWGEGGVAFVRGHLGRSLTTDALRTFGKQHLARYKIPIAFVLVDDFPRTATGKIAKTALVPPTESLR